jgi:hypothetical protein
MPPGRLRLPRRACNILTFIGGGWREVMRKTVLAIIAALAFVVSDSLSSDCAADEAPAIRHARKTVCHGPGCGPYAPCGARCRIRCPDRYSCFPLYGAYAPIGGVGYWGAYTYAGWGSRW